MNLIVLLPPLAAVVFWCMVQPFEKTPGVINVIAGYAGGTGANPTYEDYAQKGYVEVIQVTYDPKSVTYDQLLDIFWKQIDPTDAGGQFYDRGPQYRPVIFYHTPEQKEQADQINGSNWKNQNDFQKKLLPILLHIQIFIRLNSIIRNIIKKIPERYRGI